MRLNTVWCATCNKPVDRVDYARDVARMSLAIAVECHGKTEVIHVPDHKVRTLDWSALCAFSPSENLPEGGD